MPLANPVTAYDLVTLALRSLNILAQGEYPDADEQNDGLVALNDMVDAWNIERMMVWAIVRQQFNLTAGVGFPTPYQLGAGAAPPGFNYPRPARINNAGIVYNPTQPQPVELPLDMVTEQEWASIPVKSVQSTFPTVMYNDGAFPNMNLFFWPVPTTAPAVVLYMWNMVQQFADLKTQYSFPPGWARALRSNLAVEMSAQGFGGTLTPALVAIAAKSKANVKSLNAPEVVMGCDRALVNPELGQYNWITDTPSGRVF